MVRPKRPPTAPGAGKSGDRMPTRRRVARSRQASQPADAHLARDPRAPDPHPQHRTRSRPRPIRPDGHRRDPHRSVRHHPATTARRRAIPADPQPHRRRSLPSFPNCATDIRPRRPPAPVLDVVRALSLVTCVNKASCLEPSLHLRSGHWLFLLNLSPGAYDVHTHVQGRHRLSRCISLSRAPLRFLLLVSISQISRAGRCRDQDFARASRGSTSPFVASC